MDQRAIGRVLWAVTALSCGSVLWAVEPIDFSRQILPLLSDRCFHCHGPDASTREAELRLDTSEGSRAETESGGRAIVPGDPAVSELLRRISAEDEDERMPPADAKPALTPEQVKLFRQWIAEGAEYQQHWAFRAPQRPPAPPVKLNAWVRNAIDPFVLARIERAGLAPSPEADKTTLIRRLSLDLTGLPPTPAEVDAFLADESPAAYEKVVDRLLASPRYGEHMALPWLDAARYADTNGFQNDGTRTMWPWRDWVIKVLNDNMPFDEFTIEQLAGDLLPQATTSQILATGLHRNHMLNGEGGRIAEESRVEYVVDRVSTTGSIWLGLTLGCCRCHDHKFDPVSQKEFYQFYAYFNNIEEQGGVDRGGNAAPVRDLPTMDVAAKYEVLTAQAAKLEKRLSLAPDDQELARWEAWIQRRNEERQPFWELVVPTAYTSAAAADMTLEDNGILFVSGKNPANDTYALQIVTDATNITGLRLEALAHQSFTAGGLARSNSGNFVLTEIEVAVTSPEASKPVPIEVVEGQADYYQRGFPIENAFDGRADTGWAVLSKSISETRQAAFVFKEPIPGGPGTRLLITLRHDSRHAHHNLGRFRLALTSWPQPSLDESSITAEDMAILAVAPRQRTKKQRQRLVELYRETEPALVHLRAQQARTDRAIADLEKSFVTTMVMQERSSRRPTYRLERGQWDAPDKSSVLMPGVPAVLPPLPEGAPENRLALARWLVDGKHPLTARVTVNRYWQHFFGAGLVATPDDFGLQGKQPTHPLLLDFLATEFVRTGWDVKAMHRLIVTSATYRQSSQATPQRIERDPHNELLARGPRYRLSSQAIRDSALFISGLLVERIGGPPVKPYQPPGVWADMTLGKIKYQRDSGENLYRRSLYTFWRRTVGPTMLFDAATRQVCTVKAGRTNTPLHALTLMNDVTYVEAARRFAERIITEGGASPAARIEWAMRWATARKPTEKESSTLAAVLSALKKKYDGDLAAATGLVGAGESSRNAALPVPELAAYTGMASIILNLDEFVTKE